MGFMDKLRNKLDAARGGAKESTGRAADDPYLEFEGKKDRRKANLKLSTSRMPPRGRRPL